MEKFNWENPEIFKINKEDGHAIMMPFDSEKDALWDSARNADMEYVPGVTYTVTLDGFITSDNIECTEYENVNTGYSYSDHDPVYMKFKLLDE